MQFDVVLNKFTFLCFIVIAPSNPPEMFSAVTLSSTSIRFLWSPPPLESQNGIIREYRINITEAETRSIFIVTTATTSLVVPSLHPHYTYHCQVTAHTVASGPYSTVLIVKTPEDGKLCN